MYYEYDVNWNWTYVWWLFTSFSFILDLDSWILLWHWFGAYSCCKSKETPLVIMWNLLLVTCLWLSPYDSRYHDYTITLWQLLFWLVPYLARFVIFMFEANISYASNVLIFYFKSYHVMLVITFTTLYPFLFMLFPIRFICIDSNLRAMGIRFG